MASDDSTVRHWAFKGMKIAGGIGGALIIYLSSGEEFKYKISDFPVDPELSLNTPCWEFYTNTGGFA
jgi:hypothetical protein